MRFNGKESSSGIMKSVPSLSSKKKTREDKLVGLRSIGTQNESISSQLKKTGRICNSRKEAAAAAASFLQSSVEEEIDLDKQLGKERCCEDSEYMWLSSDCTTPSSFFEEYRQSSSLNPFSDEWLTSRLSLLAICYDYLDNELTLFNEAARKPMEGASSALENTILDAEKTFQNDLKEGNVVTRRLSSTMSVANALVSTVSHSENAELQSCEDSKSCDNLKSPFGTMRDSSSLIFDLDKTSYSDSLVNLDGEDSNLISDKILDFDYFQSGFPSPSYKNNLCSEVLSCSSSVPSLTDILYEKSPYSTSCEHVSEATLEDSNTDEPLFWPFECKFDWSSEESCDWFSTSPRKDILTPSKSVGVKFQSKKVAPKEGCRKRLVFSSGSTASRRIELKRQDNNKDVHKINTVPTRLSKSTKKSAKIVPLEMKDDIIEPKDRKVSIQKLVGGDDSNFSKEDFALDQDLPIEALLGLDEFDGHEGVDSGFDGDVFSLDELLC
ncbi:hypothetical protein FCV25MIE_27659 [Fagus crenata]